LVLVFRVLASDYGTSFCPNRASDEFFSSIFRSIEECLYVIQENQVITHPSFRALARGRSLRLDRYSPPNWSARVLCL